MLAEQGATSPFAPLADFQNRVRELSAAIGSKRVQAAYARAVGALDLNGAQVLRESYADRLQENWDRIGPLKYLDLPFWLRDKARILVALGLDRAAPLRILDLGCGAGHFPFVAKCHGHEVLGIDLFRPIYDDILRLLDVPRTVHRIAPRQPLPLTQKVNFVTAFALTFNFIGEEGGANRYWDRADWQWFVGHLCEHLHFPATLYFTLNRQPLAGGTAATINEVLDLFEANGATLDRRNSALRLDLAEPLTLKI